MNRIISSLLLITSVFAAVAFADAASIDRILIEVNTDTLRASYPVLDASQRELLDIVARHPDGHNVEIITNPKGLDLLDTNDIPWTTLKTREDLDNDRIDPQYLDYSEVMGSLAGYQSSYPSICQRVDLGPTHEGRRIWAMKISDNVSVHENEPEVLILANHQAREIMSVEVAMDIVDYLVTQYAGNADVQRWVNTWQIWVIPMMNPDGNAYCWSTDQYWIKNRRDNGGGAYGVNIGHNYPTFWGTCFGSTSDPTGNEYRGPSASSEPEVQAVLNFSASHRFFAVLSYHSFDEFLLLPYGCYGESAGEHVLLENLANSVAGLIGKDDGSTGYNSGCWWELLYNNDGNETDHFYSTTGAISFAIELNASSYYPAYSLRNTTVQRQRPGWQKILDLFDSGSVLYGNITDACTGQPLEASYWFDNYPPGDNELPRSSDPNTGFYALPTKPGSFVLAVTLDGYITQLIPMTIGSDPYPFDIEMVPVNEPDLTVWGTQVDDSGTGDSDWQLDPGETATLRISLLASSVPVTGITGILSSSDPNITISDNSASWPDLTTGQTAWSQGNSFTVQASPSTPEGHMAVFTLDLDTNETLCDTEKNFTLIVKALNYQCPFWEERFDADPGWTITSSPTSGSPAGPYNNWEFGVPQSGPGSAYTGEYVYGTGLDANYDNRWFLTLTSPAIDCTNLTDAELNYARFLRVEDGWDHGHVYISNNGGSSWTRIFSTVTEPGWTNDSNWAWHTIDIASHADGHANVKLRFEVESDSSISDDGFFIDDVQICGYSTGSSQPDPTATMPPTWTPTPIYSPTAIPSYTPTPPTPTPTFTPSATAGPGEPTNTPITPTNTPTIPMPTATPTAPDLTPTPTIPGQPTNTPNPSPTPEYSPTPKPSMTPTGTPPTPTPTPDVPTSTPTPPSDPFSILLTLSGTEFSAGDEFHLQCRVVCNGPAVTADQYIILDVYGVYFFWPTWTDSLDYETRTFPAGYDSTESILNFTWPQVGGHAAGLRIYAGCLYTGTATLVGDISLVEFGY